jgi:hypothetical protein
MPEPIIATKISLPPQRAGLVARPRLLALLDEAAAHSWRRPALANRPW